MKSPFAATTFTLECGVEPRVGFPHLDAGRPRVLLGGRQAHGVRTRGPGQGERERESEKGKPVPGLPHMMTETSAACPPDTIDAKAASH